MNNLYDEIGKGYSIGRKTDPQLASIINKHIGGADSLVNIGAGTGSYEPAGSSLIAVEPSIEMIRQRSAGCQSVVQAIAELLPFKDRSFTHAMTMLSMHHWKDRKSAFDEIKRIVTKRFVAITWNPNAERYWLTKDYFPEIHDIDQQIFPALDELRESFPKIEFYPMPVPSSCVDGFTAAYWARPEAYLDPMVRSCMSSFSKIIGVEKGVEKLRSELNSGEWKSKYGSLTNRKNLDVGYVIAVWDVDDRKVR